MESNQNSGAAPGWVGGFAESNPAFAYPDPNLTSLPAFGNMANIEKIQRQQKVKWPEFSWETIPGNSDSRCFQQFATDISSLGYDDVGRVWSIICPQQGVNIPGIGNLNVEVTVLKQKGWVNETDRQIAADLSVEGTIWFSPDSHQNEFVKEAWKLFDDKSLPFPSNKKDAIKVTTHMVGHPEHPLFQLQSGQSTLFEAPGFAQHENEAWAVGNLGVQIGPIEKTGHEVVDAFNQTIMDVFNIGSGNMLHPENVLTWNVWFTPPALVNTLAWRTHAWRWRRSLDVNHTSPDGSVSSAAMYFDGSLFKPLENLEEEAKEYLEHIEKTYLKGLKKDLFSHIESKLKL